MKISHHTFRAAVLAAVIAVVALLPFASKAQVVTQLPVSITAGVVKDLGNGPLELKVIQGSTALFTSQGSATGTAPGTTALTLTGTPATPPIVGGFITCSVATACSIPASTTVTAYNGTTGVTLSAAATITAAVVNYGAACPASIGSIPAFFIQASVGGDWPLYTQARLCAASPNSSAVVLPFAIGAH